MKPAPYKRILQSVAKPVKVIDAKHPWVGEVEVSGFFKTPSKYQKWKTQQLYNEVLRSNFIDLDSQTNAANRYHREGYLYVQHR